MKTDNNKGLLKILGKGVVSSPFIFAVLSSPLAYVGYEMHQHHQNLLESPAYVDSYNVANDGGFVIYTYGEGFSESFKGIIGRVEGGSSLVENSSLEDNTLWSNVLFPLDSYLINPEDSYLGISAKNSDGDLNGFGAGYKFNY